MTVRGIDLRPTPTRSPGREGQSTSSSSTSTGARTRHGCGPAPSPDADRRSYAAARARSSANKRPILRRARIEFWTFRNLGITRVLCWLARGPGPSRRWPDHRCHQGLGESQRNRDLCRSRALGRCRPCTRDEPRGHRRGAERSLLAAAPTPRLPAELPGPRRASRRPTPRHRRRRATSQRLARLTRPHIRGQQRSQTACRASSTTAQARGGHIQPRQGTCTWHPSSAPRRRGLRLDRPRSRLGPWDAVRLPTQESPEHATSLTAAPGSVRSAALAHFRWWLRAVVKSVSLRVAGLGLAAEDGVGRLARA
ncbi:hypothetical protein EV386_0969 [Xylanimonas ulmi]|uniref:Uncharacterized protein n=1 Tax=Xylanimonas ulmi TaxID=228973 RepID=A0A4Q7LZ92_9MICO|nr:hypothetical protein EV386_0969 [Xylanibacterium ulmi]